MISTPKRIVYRHARVCNQPTLILSYYHLLSDRIPAASRRFIVFRNKPGVQGKRKKSLPSSRKTGAAAPAFPDLPLSVTDTLRIPDGHASLFLLLETDTGISHIQHFPRKCIFLSGHIIETATDTSFQQEKRINSVSNLSEFFR